MGHNNMIMLLGLATGSCSKEQPIPVGQVCQKLFNFLKICKGSLQKYYQTALL
jgi:hypothetical protein